MFERDAEIVENHGYRASIAYELERRAEVLDATSARPFPHTPSASRSSWPRHVGLDDEPGSRRTPAVAADVRRHLG